MSSPEQHWLKPEDLYAERINAFTDEDRVPEELAREFHVLLRNVILKLSLGRYDEKDTLYRKEVMEVWAEGIREHDIFPLELSGAEYLENADIVLGNHQGKHGGGTTGGLETLMIYNMAPAKTSVVLSKDLIKYDWWNPVDYIKSRVFSRANPIPFDKHRDLKGNKKLYSAAMATEFQKVSRNISNTMQEGTQVILYPEGENSPDGKFARYKGRLFVDTAKDYILPRIEKGEDLRIALSVADTIATFPHGYAKDIAMYQQPFRIKGIPYDPTALIAYIQSVDSPDDHHEGIAKFFADDAQKQTERALSEMLLQDTITQYDGGSPDQQSLSDDHR